MIYSKISMRLFTTSVALVFFLLLNTLGMADGNNSSPGAIKEIVFKKVLEIKEKDDSFFFQFPSSTRFDSQENLYILDNNQIMKLSKEGTFSKILTSKGEGPAETTNISGFQVTPDSVVIHNNYPSKIIRLDLNGKLKKEMRLVKTDFIKFLFTIDNKYYFHQSRYPENSPNEKYEDMNYEVFWISQDGTKTNPLHVYPVRNYFLRNGGSTGAFGIAEFVTVLLDNRYFFVSNTTDYKISCLDLRTGKIINKFGSQYEKQEIPEEFLKKYSNLAIGLDGKMFKRPPQKYFNDICQLLIYKKDIWVVTSTVDKNKGVLVDVFTRYGKKRNSFYLSLPGHNDYHSPSLYINGDYLYTIESPEEDDPLIIKYKISL